MLKSTTVANYRTALLSNEERALGFVVSQKGPWKSSLILTERGGKGVFK